jgi:hypothetical protein
MLGASAKKKEKTENMEREDVKTKKDLMIYILLMLNEKAGTFEMTQLFLKSGYALGIESFENLMDELQENKWIKIHKTPTGTVPNMPWLITNTITYDITLTGVEHLISLGLVEDKFAKQEKEKEKQIKHTTINGGQVIINEESNNGNQSLSDNAFASPTIQKTNKKIDKSPKKSWIEVISWITGIIIAIIGIYEFIIKQQI